MATSFANLKTYSRKKPQVKNHSTKRPELSQLPIKTEVFEPESRDMKTYFAKSYSKSEKNKVQLIGIPAELPQLPIKIEVTYYTPEAYSTPKSQTTKEQSTESTAELCQLPIKTEVIQPEDFELVSPTNKPNKEGFADNSELDLQIKRNEQHVNLEIVRNIALPCEHKDILPSNTFKTELFKCSKCSVFFIARRSLITHLNRNCDIKKSKCPICAVDFNFFSVSRHISLHHVKLKLCFEDFVITELPEVDELTKQQIDLPIPPNAECSESGIPSKRQRNLPVPSKITLNNADKFALKNSTDFVIESCRCRKNENEESHTLHNSLNVTSNNVSVGVLCTEQNCPCSKEIDHKTTCSQKSNQDSKDQLKSSLDLNNIEIKTEHDVDIWSSHESYQESKYSLRYSLDNNFKMKSEHEVDISNSCDEMNQINTQTVNTYRLDDLKSENNVDILSNHKADQYSKQYLTYSVDQHNIGINSEK